MKACFPIKTLLCLLVFSILYQTPARSQCANGTAPSVISYDTVLLGEGYSNFDLAFPQFDTNKVYLTFPQFDLSKGTLIQVDIQTVMSVKYSYTLENQDNVPKTFAVKINRHDIIESPVLFSPYEKFKQKIVASHALPATDGTSGSGPDFVEVGPLYAYDKVPVDYFIKDNLAGFMGNGQVNFTYETQTDLFPTGTGYVWNPTTKDSLYFKLTYHYCLTSLLPADITNFNAVKTASGRVSLSWSSPNDRAGNRFEIEKSIDGRNYSSFQTIVSKSSAKNDYQVNYVPTVQDKNHVFFRIKQTEADGNLKYSLVKNITLDYSSTIMKVYPTITTNNVNIYFPYAQKGDYMVSIVSLTGQVLQQSEFLKTSFIKLDFVRPLKAGLYLISVVNKQSSERQQQKLVIQ